MKMKATESGSIREQGNGAETDNTVREEKKKTNKRTSVEKAQSSVRQYEKESPKKRRREKVKRQYIYGTQ